MVKLAKYLNGYKKQVILGPIFKLIEAIFELIIPLIMANIIDIGIKNSDTQYILHMLGMMILIGITGLISAILGQFYAAKASQGFGTAIRNSLFCHINNLSFSDLDSINASSLITRMTNDINQLQVAVSMLIRLVIRAPFLILGSIFMAMSINITISLIFIATALIIGIIIFFITKITVPYFKKIQNTLDKISLIVKENLSGIRVIRAFSKQESEINKFLKSNNLLSQTAINVNKISALLNPATYLIINLAITCIIWVGSKKAFTGEINQGVIIALVNYMTQILLSLIVVANVIIIFTKASASAARINATFELSTSLEPHSANPSIQKSKSNKVIEFKDVSFCYDKDCDNSLNGITFSLNKSETLGIIGGTGSGKSTLIQLIGGFYKNNCGEILIYGNDINSYDEQELRKIFGFVPQKAVLFSGTILDNMRWRNPNAKYEDIKKALDIAQASEFVEKLPLKYNTKVEQGGKNFSGGQRQRLTIARALVSNPEILILDDSSSALDAHTDELLRKALITQCKEITKIIISQKCSSIAHADKIIVLDNGRQIGYGTHDSLLNSCPIYKKIFESQKM